MSLKKLHTVYLVLGTLLTAQIGGLFYNSGTVKGMNTRADKLKIYAQAEREDATILPGNICDRNGEIRKPVTVQKQKLTKKERRQPLQFEKQHIKTDQRILSYSAIPAKEN